jgi:hypothetical protein
MANTCLLTILSNYVDANGIKPNASDIIHLNDELTIDNTCLLTILSNYVDANGIKPNANDIITINDDELTMANKFTRYYKKCFDFAGEDYRDMIEFKRINNNFMDTTYTNIIKDTELENNLFIQNMLYYISNYQIGAKYKKTSTSLLFIISSYVDSNGIKPNANDVITSNDDELTMVNKFNSYYSKCFDFACGDYRDMIGFKRLNNKFIETTYTNIINDTELENNLFIQNMLYHISDEKIGTKYDVSLISSSLL